MAGFENFEDIDAWKKARELTKTIYQISSCGGFAKDFGLGDQIRRAAVSIMSNIAEGFERGGDKEFLQFLAIAKGSAGEVRSQLYIALDVGYLTSDDFNQLHQLVNQTSRLIVGLMRYLANSNQNGNKFKGVREDESLWLYNPDPDL